jgi:hypothetical protein
MCAIAKCAPGFISSHVRKTAGEGIYATQADFDISDVNGNMRTVSIAYDQDKDGGSDNANDMVW